MAVPLKKFVQQLSDSGVMSKDDITAFVNSLSPEPQDGEQLAKALVKNKKLTTFQVQRIYQGKFKGLTLGDYQILDRIGAGGMGQVYLAEHRRMGRKVALKTLPEAVAKDSQTIQRFQREVRAAAKLFHPNVVTAFDAGEAGGVHYFVMEYVQGIDLSQLVKQQGTLSLQQALDFVLQTAKGLEYAHNKGITHRDIKPANLLLDKEGTVKILDMGLARLETDEDEQPATELTSTGSIMGTVDYMAPEQALDTKNADARSDIYSLSCVLHYLLTGKAVYNGDTILKKVLAHREQPIPSLVEQRTDVSQSVDDLFRQMMAKNPEERFQTMTEVIEAIQSCGVLELEASGAHRSGNSQTLPPSDPNMRRFLDGLNQTDIPTIVQPSVQPQSPAETETLPSGVLQETLIGGIGEAEKLSSKVKSKPWGLIAAGLLGVLILLSGLILKLQTPAGTIVLEIDQPEIVGAQVLIDGNKCITIKTGKGTESIRVRPDKERHKLDVQMAGFKTFTEEFIYDTGNEKKITVRLIPLADTVADKGEQKVMPVVAPKSSENWALEFDGDSFAEIQSNSKLVSIDSAFTIEAWVIATDQLKLKSTTIIRIPDTAALFIDLNGKLSAALSSIGEDTNESVRLSGSPAQVHKLTHLANVWNGVEFKFYIDGVEVESKRVAAQLGFGSINATKNIVLGSMDQSGSRNLNFSGIIDEVRISNVARYDKDFTPRKRFENDGQTLAIYHFDEGSGDVLKDSSGNGHHGKIVGAKWVRGDDAFNVHGDAASNANTYNWPQDQPDPAIAPFTPEEAKQHQEEWAKHLGLPVEMENSIGMKFRVIPPGNFLMGTSEEEIKKLIEEANQHEISERIRREGLQHKVTLSKPFGVAIHEVTRGQFRKFVEATGYETDAEKDGEGGSGFKDGKVIQAPEFLWNTKVGFETEQTDKHPVVNVSWNDAATFCEWLSEQEGVTYRLPTEAEWEFACRAGNPGRYSLGDDESKLAEYAWFGGQGGSSTNPVGQKAANPLGLFDLHGNVWEWCHDGIGAYTASPAIDPVGLKDSNSLVVRGGAFGSQASNVRSACRGSGLPSDRSCVYGFRLARTFDSSP